VWTSREGIYVSYDSNDAIPHLVRIGSTISTGENYTLNYLTRLPLASPFTPPVSFGTTGLLQSVTTTGLNMPDDDASRRPQPTFPKDVSIG
jgi:hypothetical protein